MPLNSRLYVSIMLGGIALICIACLALRWRILALQQEPVRTGVQPTAAVISPSKGRVQLLPDPPSGSDDPAPALTETSSTSDPVTPERQEAQPNGSSDSGRLDLNTASAAELDELPGIGPVLAERIVMAREQRAGFRSLDELLEVEGIGSATLEHLRPLLRIDAVP
ncbi:helix-hairpin-helix domain-containing protein [bacterium]|nr:helix-hairpin-helix domain-containing protein [bacterium]